MGPMRKRLAGVAAVLFLAACHPVAGLAPTEGDGQGTTTTTEDPTATSVFICSPEPTDPGCNNTP